MTSPNIFDPIKIPTRLALKNDRQNLSFVKDIYVLKMTRNYRKLAQPKVCLFFKSPVFTLT